MNLKSFAALLTALACTASMTMPIALAKDYTISSNTYAYKELAKLCSESSEYIDSIEFQIDNSRMKVNGESVLIDPEQGDKTSPKLIEHRRTMLPARALVETLGGEIDYVAKNTVHIVAEDQTEIILKVGSCDMYVNGETVQLDIAPFVENGRTYIPIRAVSESMGCDVNYHQRIVTVTQPCQSCRLVVLADNPNNLPDTQPSKTIDFGDGAYVLVYSTVSETINALAKLEKTSGISAWPDTPVQLEAQGQSSSQITATAWQDEHCGLTSFRDANSGSRPVTVAVIDSGIDSTFANLYQDRILKNGYDVITGEIGVIPADGFGHGTLISSLITAYTPSNVKILPIRIFNADGNTDLNPTYSSQWLSIFRYIQNAGGNLVNMSLNCYDPANNSSHMEKLIQRELIDKGISMVCAAGNEGVDTIERIPAKMKSAIVVASSNQNDQPSSNSTVTSNYGESVDLAAPGEQILGIGRKGQSEQGNGTSFAAPLVTAACGVLLSKQDYQPAALESQIKKYTSPFASSAQGFGTGVLNLKAANPIPTPTVKFYRYSVSMLSLDVGDRANVQVTAEYSDGSTKDVTSSCGLYSSDPDIASVSQAGIITAHQAGSAKISMKTLPSGVSLPTPISVSVQKPENPTPTPTPAPTPAPTPTPTPTPTVKSYRYSVSTLSLDVGDRVNIQVMAEYTDGSTKDVTSFCGLYSSNPYIASVSQTGTITALQAGNTKISMGTLPNGVSIPTPISVNIQKPEIPTPTPAPMPVPTPTIKSYRYNFDTLSLEVGESKQLKVTAEYSDGSTKDVTSSCGLYSMDSSIVSVSQDGMIKALQAGSTRISMGTLPNGVSIPTPIQVTVTETIEFSPEVPVEKVLLTTTGLTSATLLTMSPGENITMQAVILPRNATNQNVTWKSSDTSVVSVSEGSVHAVGLGTCVITATVGNQSASCNVWVTEYDVDDYEIESVSGPMAIQNGDSGTFRVKIKTPLPYETGSHPLVLYCALRVPDAKDALNGWLEYQSVYYDGGSSTVEYVLDTSLYDIPDGEYMMAFSLFFADHFYTGASICGIYQSVTLT